MSESKENSNRFIDSFSENTFTFLAAIFVPTVLGLLSWQYCKGYFQTLGINISYSLLENLIFVFDQISAFSFQTDNWVGWLKVVRVTVILLGVTTLINAIVSISFHKRKSIKHEVDRLTGKKKIIRRDFYPISVLILLILFFIFIAILSILRGTALLAATVILLNVINLSQRKKSLKPIIFFMVALLAAKGFYTIGESDAESLIKTEFKNLPTVCVSRPVGELSDTSPKFLICGKLVFTDSRNICLKEELNQQIRCLLKEKYETTTSPNVA